MHDEAIKILLVDDEQLVREELGGLLRDQGYAVLTGADGEEGLALFRDEQPDLVISDVRMPRRDGLSLAETIRAEAPHVPVTVITGHGTEAMAIEALRTGVTDFIKKPVRLDALASALARMKAARQLATPHQPVGLPSSVVAVDVRWRYDLDNRVDAIPLFVDHLLRRCTDGIESRTHMELSLALRELLINAVEHGNLGVTFAEKTRALEDGTLEELLAERQAAPNHAHKRVRVTTTVEPTRLTVTIEDEGDGFDWAAFAGPMDPLQQLASHGRGILLARMSVDELTYNAAGNRATIAKDI